jgi:hypothetical protein
VSAEREPDLSAIDVTLLVQRYVIVKRTKFYDEAVALGIIDYGQRCALLQMVVRDIARERHEEEQWEAAGRPEVWPPEEVT